MNIEEAPPRKPQIKEIEVDRAETIAGIKAEQTAMAQGAAPEAARALMLSGSGNPILHGFTFKGIQGGGVVLATILAIQMVEERFKPKYPVQKGIVGMLCFVDPQKVYELLEQGKSDEVGDWANRTLMQSNLTAPQYNEIERFLQTTLKDTSQTEDEPGFQKPGPPSGSAE